MLSLHVVYCLLAINNSQKNALNENVLTKSIKEKMYYKLKEVYSFILLNIKSQMINQ